MFKFTIKKKTNELNKTFDVVVNASFDTLSVFKRKEEKKINKQDRIAPLAPVCSMIKKFININIRAKRLILGVDKANIKEKSVIT